MQNRIDAVLKAADKDLILQLVQDIRDKMPFLIDLSVAEIAALSKMGDRGKPFVQDALTLAEQDDSFLPRSFDVAAMRRDVDLLEMLPSIITSVSRLKELLDDTYILAGSDAFTAALTVYGSAQKNGKGSALNQSLTNLGKRFARKGKAKTPAETPKP